MDKPKREDQEFADRRALREALREIREEDKRRRVNSFRLNRRRYLDREMPDLDTDPAEA